MSQTKVTYEVQKNVGHLEKRWEAVSYDLDTIDEALPLKRKLVEYNKDCQFRIVRKTLKIEAVQ